MGGNLKACFPLPQGLRVAHDSAVIPSPLNRLLTWSRMVWMIIRAAESSVVAALFAAAGAMIVVAVQAWLGEPSLPLVMALIVVAAGCGAMASLMRVPSKLAVAQRIDRQFGLHDLLSTSLQLLSQPAQADPAMRAIILSQCAAAAGRIPVSGVALARLPRRTYAAAGLAVALVLTVSALASPRDEAMLAGVGRSAAAPSSSAEPEVAAAAQEAALDRSADERSADGAQPRRETEPGNTAGAAGETRDVSQAVPLVASTDPPKRATQLEQEGITGSGSRQGHLGDATADGEITGSHPRSDDDNAIATRPRAANPTMPPGREVPTAYRDLVRRYFMRD